MKNIQHATCKRCHASSLNCKIVKKLRLLKSEKLKYNIDLNMRQS